VAAQEMVAGCCGFWVDGEIWQAITLQLSNWLLRRPVVAAPLACPLRRFAGSTILSITPVPTGPIPIQITASSALVAAMRRAQRDRIHYARLVGLAPCHRAHCRDPHRSVRRPAAGLHSTPPMPVQPLLAPRLRAPPLLQ
jgi:hypothetical protein